PPGPRAPRETTCNSAAGGGTSSVRGTSSTRGNGESTKQTCCPPLLGMAGNGGGAVSATRPVILSASREAVRPCSTDGSATSGRRPSSPGWPVEGRPATCAWTAQLLQQVFTRIRDQLPGRIGLLLRRRQIGLRCVPLSGHSRLGSNPSASHRPPALLDQH